MATARDIYEQVLNQLSAAVWTNDTEAFCKLVRLPFVMKSIDGDNTHYDLDKVRRGVTSYHKTLQAHGITDYVRRCDTAQFVSDTQISGYHSTYLRKDGVDVAPPYLTRMSLFRQDKTWRVGISDSALRTSDWPLMGKDFFDTTPVDASETQARLRVFQAILDRISAAFVGGDVEGWLNCVALPYQMITRQGVDSFETRAQVIEDFEAYQVEFKTHGVSEILRQAKTCEIIDDDMMTGTYRTHIMRGGNHVVPPWDASMTLRRDDGNWRVTTVMRAIGHQNWSALTPADIEKTPEFTPDKGDRK